LKAIEDFTLAIKSGSLSDDKQLEAYYNLADSYVNIHDLNKAILNWRKILEINPAYKDVDEKVATYSQLNENSLLEKYLFGSASQFTSICKHFVKVYINRYSRLKGFVKFNKIQQQVNNSLEMYVEVSTKNFVELYYFLFMRSATTVGDLTLRIIYNKLRDEKIDKGVCVTAGNFSPTAKDFVESRMLELVEREKTSEILSKVKEMIGKE
ncbi:MAG TPA: tetratricopeptide repeat protein, partial [Spirochaetota bacterium]|nr:tetratricopeptide repeat protein [Spirochaetota bacterium]